MKPIRIDLSENLREIEIIPIADVHLGDPMCNYKHFMETLEYIKERDNVFCVLNGDLMDCAIKASIGDSYSAALQPMEQLHQCVKIFEPIKDKILCVLPGNHEERIYKTDGVDMTRLMCDQLGIADRYSSTTALLFVRFGRDCGRTHHSRKECYTIYCNHGIGGGRREGGKVNRVADLASVVDADIYVAAHTHLPFIMRERFFRVSASNSSVSIVDKLFINTSAQLEYGGYGDRAAFKPASIETPVICLSGTEKKMRATL